MKQRGLARISHLGVFFFFALFGCSSEGGSDTTAGLATETGGGATSGTGDDPTGGGAETGAPTTTAGTGGDGGPAGAVAHELCRLMMQECDCPQQVFSSIAECEAAVAAQFAAEAAPAEAAGLIFDPTCLEPTLQFLRETVACHTFTELSGDLKLLVNSGLLGGADCKLYSGAGEASETCTSYSSVFGDSCVQGLACLGVCTQLPPAPKQVGEPCDFNDLCAAGSSCLAPPDDPLGPLTCRPLPALGEPCIDGIGCTTGFTCVVTDIPLGEGVCGPLPVAGEPCSDEYLKECAEGFYCDTSQFPKVCAPILPEGTPCEDDDACGLNAMCDEAPNSSQDVCQPEEPLVCI